MTKQEWIRAVVSHIADEDQRKAIARQLDEKLSKMIDRETEGEVLRRLGDPTEYYEKHFSGKASKNFNLIAGAVLILIGAFLLIFGIPSSNNIVFEQVQWFPATRNGFFYGAGLILALGIITLLRGVRKRSS